MSSDSKQDCSRPTIVGYIASIIDMKFLFGWMLPIVNSVWTRFAEILIVLFIILQGFVIDYVVVISAETEGELLKKYPLDVAIVIGIDRVFETQYVIEYTNKCYPEWTHRNNSVD